MLCPVLGLPMQERYQLTGMSPMGEQPKSLGAEAHDVPGEAEDAGLVHPAGENIWGIPNCSSPPSNGKGE